MADGCSILYLLIWQAAFLVHTSQGWLGEETGSKGSPDPRSSLRASLIKFFLSYFHCPVSYLTTTFFASASFFLWRHKFMVYSLEVRCRPSGASPGLWRRKKGLERPVSRRRLQRLQEGPAGCGLNPPCPCSLENGTQTTAPHPNSSQGARKIA